MSYQKDPANDEIAVNEQLVANFVDTLKGEHRHTVESFLGSFRVLLEQHGFPISDEKKFESFWNKVRAHAQHYFERQPGFHALVGMEYDAHLSDDASELIQEYYRIFCLPTDVQSPSVIASATSTFAAREMHSIHH